MRERQHPKHWFLPCGEVIRDFEQCHFQKLLTRVTLLHVHLIGFGGLRLSYLR